MKRFFLALVLLLGIASLELEASHLNYPDPLSQNPQNCQATFLYDAIGTSVNFIDLSYALDSIQDWTWDFGDGTSSSVKNPLHSYATSGSYSVTLTIVAGNCISSTTNLIYLDSLNVQDCFADFWYFNLGYDVIFADASWSTGTIQSWLWNFGDGSNSSLQNPQHTYAYPGIYDVSLTIQADSCTSTIIYSVFLDSLNVQNCVADFWYSNIGTDVTFSDYSSAVSPIQSWFWDFGDGSTSMVQNPLHSYSNPGVYDVSLTILADSCTDSVTYSIWIDTLNTTDCFADFTYTGGINPLGGIMFFDNSWATSPIQSWYWDFGDGGN
jgi:tripartite motif-containing protein 71